MLRGICGAVLALALAWSAISCGGRTAAPAGSAATPESGSTTTTAFPVSVTDDEGVEITLDAPPDRIVTFAPSHTEIAFALGVGDKVVGVSGAFDDVPPAARSIEPVGGAGGVEPNIEKVLSLDPDVVISAFIGGDWKERLRELGVPVFTTLAASLDDALDDIETLGRLLGAETEGERLAADLAEEAEATESELEQAEPVSCFLDYGDLFTVGPGSLEFDLLERAGCDPITASASEPYPQWSLEQLVADDPDVYLVSEGVSLRQVTRRPGIRDLTAVREGRVASVDPDLITRPGPRLVQGLEAMAEAIHGQAAAAA
jgi:iron complex transport system substrate-binding protein